MSVKKLSDDKNIHSCHRQRLRERYKREGAAGFEPHVLLELFLFDIIPRSDTNPIAHRLIERFGSLDGVFRAKYDELIKVKGVGNATARYIVDVAASMTNMIRDELSAKPIVTFERAANFLIWHMRNSEAEAFSVLALDESLALIKTVDIICDRPLEEISDMILKELASENVSNIIIGYKADSGLTEQNVVLFASLLGKKVNVCDIIELSLYDARSVI